MLLKFFLTFRILFVFFCLENLTITLFGPLLGNQWQSSMLEETIQYPAFWTTWKLCLSVLNFPSTRGGHLVLNISVWSTDSYSSTIVPIKQYAPSVLSWLALRRKALTSFSDNFAQGQVFLYLRLPRWNQICSGIPEPKQLIHP